jgi:hypothetical protein
MTTRGNDARFFRRHPSIKHSIRGDLIFISDIYARNGRLKSLNIPNPPPQGSDRDLLQKALLAIAMSPLYFRSSPKRSTFSFYLLSLYRNNILISRWSIHSGQGPGSYSGEEYSPARCSIVRDIAPLVHARFVPMAAVLLFLLPLQCLVQ